MRMRVRKRVSSNRIARSPRLHPKLDGTSHDSSNDLGHSLIIHTVSKIFFQSYLTPEHWPWRNLENDNIAISKDGFRDNALIVPSYNYNNTNKMSVWASFSKRELTVPA